MRRHKTPAIAQNEESAMNHGPSRRPTPILRACMALALLALSSLPALALDVDLDVDGKPEEVCLNTEKTMRMVMNIWANGALETYAEVKPELEKTLGAHGERGAKVLPVYQQMMPRIEAGEFLPPNVVSRYEGHQKLRAVTHQVCMKALAG
jgi:hypothetical protein